MNLNISTSVITFIICLKKITYKNEIAMAVKKLICIEFSTTNKNDFLFFLPNVKPTMPSVEKANASRKKAAKIINCNKIAFTAK